MPKSNGLCAFFSHSLSSSYAVAGGALKLNHQWWVTGVPNKMNCGQNKATAAVHTTYKMDGAWDTAAFNLEPLDHMIYDQLDCGFHIFSRNPIISYMETLFKSN